MPSKHEGALIRNLHAHNLCGIILSWAHLWQSGHRHVNNHGEAYLRQVFGGLGYILHGPLTRALRDPKRRSRASAGRPSRADTVAGMPARATGPIYDYFATNTFAFARALPLSPQCRGDAFDTWSHGRPKLR